jgi:hypothetical protein
LDRDSSMASISPGPHEGGPTVTVNLNDGPLQGKSIETAVVVGRPPMTIDVATGRRGQVRHGLADSCVRAAHGLVGQLEVVDMRWTQILMGGRAGELLAARGGSAARSTATERPTPAPTPEPAPALRRAWDGSGRREQS